MRPIPFAIAIGDRGVDEVADAKLYASKSQLGMWYARKESYWKQMSKDHLLKDVDRNTKYFQMVASIKTRQKLMVEIKKGRRLLSDPRSIKKRGEEIF